MKPGSNEYINLHIWIVNNFGKASKCKYCNGKHAKRFEWALIHGKKYEKNIENFMELCPSCHRKYDMKGKIGCASKPIIQIDKISNKIIAEYDSITNAIKENKFGKSANCCISQMIHGRTKTACGYKWRLK